MLQCLSNAFTDAINLWLLRRLTKTFSPLLAALSNTDKGPEENSTFLSSPTAAVRLASALR